MRIYLDVCTFNRPFDDQSLLKNYLEAEAKTYIQKEILQDKYELVWSYMMDYEISFNPFLDRKSQIIKWKAIAITDVDESEKIVSLANKIMAKNIKSKDSLHLACAIDAECNFFITTDSRILNKCIEGIVVINPMDFVKIMEVRK